MATLNCICAQVCFFIYTSFNSTEDLRVLAKTVKQNNGSKEIKSKNENQGDLGVKIQNAREKKLKNISHEGLWNFDN